MAIENFNRDFNYIINYLQWIPKNIILLFGY